MFVKDPQREYKDLLAEHKIGFISKVVYADFHLAALDWLLTDSPSGVSKLRGKHAPFEARRLLQKSHSLFLADARILPLLIPLLGNAFINTKSLPIPVDLASPRPSLKAELERAIGGTTLRLSSGTCLNLKLGSATRHSKTELQANLETVVTHLAAKLPLGGWDNVQALHVKSGTSTSLPIWNASLEADVPGGRFSALPESEAKKKAEATERKDKAKAERQERKEKKEKKLAKRRSEPEAVDEAPAAKKTKRTDAQSAAKKAKADVPSTSAQPRPTLPDAELSLVDGSPVVPTPAPTKPNKKAPAAPAGSTAATVSAAPKASDAPSAGKSKETRNKGKAAPAGEAKPKKSVSSASKKVKGLSKVKA